MIRNKNLITAAVLASFSNLTFAEDVIIKLKEVSVQSPADQNTALNLKKINSTCCTNHRIAGINKGGRA